MRAKRNNPTPQLTEDQKLRSIDRAGIVIGVFFLVGMVILGKAFYIQVINHKHYTELADKQYISLTGGGFDRGAIYFAHYKNEPGIAAELRSVYRIAVNPNQITDKEMVYKELSQHIDIDKDDFMTRASKQNDPYEEIAKNVSEEVVKKLREKNLVGISYIKENKRAYPQDEVAASTIGFVGNDGTRVRGQYGVERYYDDVLSRVASNRRVNFFAELFTNIEKTIASNTDMMEGDVMLTIDVEAQRALHNILVETRNQWKSDTIGGIIMDPKTGEIVAMDSLPSFNPNDFSGVEDTSVFVNQNVSGVYEMGSIIKPLTMAAAFDSGAVTLETTYNDTGIRELNGYKVKNYDSQARGPNTTMQTILDKSLNVGIVFLVEQLGIKRFAEYFNNFGIGEETGIDLPNEAKGLSKNLKSGVLVDSATAGFGQGIAITPIQTIRALGALANHGKLVTPHVVKSIVYKNGTVKKIVQDEQDQVISEKTSEAVSRMLVHVVDTSLNKGTLKMDGYSIAAKTGTAQMVKPGGGYYEGRYLHSFFGYFPAYEPRYIVFLFHTYPKGAEYASATLSEPFFKIVKFLISYYEIPPDR